MSSSRMEESVSRLVSKPNFRSAVTCRGAAIYYTKSLGRYAALLVPAEGWWILRGHFLVFKISKVILISVGILGEGLFCDIL